MATSEHGIAYLDLSGNRIVWSPSDPNHSTILLDPVEAHRFASMAMLAVSSICLVSFIILSFAACGVRIGRTYAQQYLPWRTLWIPLFCMIGFFGSDVANRVMHLLGQKLRWEYIGIDVGIGCLSAIADGLLMVYLMKKSPIDTTRAKYLAYIAMILAITIYSLISAASKGTEIWSVLAQGDPDFALGGTDSGDDSKYLNRFQIYQALSSAASGMQLLFAIGFAMFSITFVRHLSRKYALRTRLSSAVAILAACFLMRNVVQLTFTLLYSQYQKIAGLTTQFVYMVLYGFLSVAIYTCVVVVAAVQREQEAGIDGQTYHKVRQTPVSDGAHRPRQEMPPPNVVHPNRYETGYLQRNVAGNFIHEKKYAPLEQRLADEGSDWPQQLENPVPNVTSTYRYENGSSPRLVAVFPNRNENGSPQPSVVYPNPSKNEGLRPNFSYPQRYESPQRR